MKKILSLLLVAVMLLSLVACRGGDNNTETTPNNNNSQNGESNTTQLQKLERGTKTTTDNPLFALMKDKLEKISWKYSLKEDGTCGDNVFWWIVSDTEKSLSVYVSDEYKYKYALTIWRDGDSPILRLDISVPMYMDDYFVDWMPPYMEDMHYIPFFGGEHDLVENLCKTWVKPDESTEAPFEEITFYQDGTCLIEGAPYVWTISKSGYGVTDATHLFVKLWEINGNWASFIGCVNINSGWDVLSCMLDNGGLLPGGLIPKEN
jgi:hypothetical protein